MTLTELQEMLGERIKVTADLSKSSLSAESKQAELAISQSVASLAKQMINNADVILRADKLKRDSADMDTVIAKLI